MTEQQLRERAVFALLAAGDPDGRLAEFGAEPVDSDRTGWLSF